MILAFSDRFSKKGIFLIEKVHLVANNRYTDPKVVALVVAVHLGSGDRVSATSDKFEFTDIFEKSEYEIYNRTPDVEKWFEKDQ